MSWVTTGAFSNPNPNPDPTSADSTLPLWVAYDTKTDELIVLKEFNDIYMIGGVKKKECAFLIPLIGSSLHHVFPSVFEYQR